MDLFTYFLDISLHGNFDNVIKISPITHANFS